ncbi:hypothetical protein G6F70_001311 [Rhizopus microsporus]|nr:hypothetical protein G6F71_001427 [Rhizopus microsporus]KAG1203518.1 hypothetical protein G6F70_001311 [Rhizopus microsporus]KAG1215150.1 hypothetical protein G6F69_001274 [Rhizopus microsporus]KAG1236543.1 hypothetical protein G6F67_001913 [Rhizopus microsporus]KAG1268143.1 hypothetical protein G6F68_001367 [Rhizopus microsporus]
MTSKKEDMEKYKQLQYIQDMLDDLSVDRESIEIVFMSIKNAFSTYPKPKVEDIEEEIKIQYDDLAAQVRHLDRSLAKLDRWMKSL